MIVYTANYGKRDHPIPPNQLCEDLEGIKFVYFTDHDHWDYGRSTNPTPKGWEIRVEEGKFADPRMSAKWYKLHSHELFPDEPSVWIDAHYSLVVRPEREFAALSEDKPMVVFKHYYERLGHEYDVVGSRQPHYKSLVNHQRARYINDGFDANESAVYRGAMLFRHPGAAEFNQIWWGEVMKYEHRRDQLSLPYALWRSGIKYTVFDDAEERVYKVNKHLPHPRVRPLPT